VTRPDEILHAFTAAAKPRNQTRDQFARGCRNVCGKPPTPTGPDGESRSKEEALVLARKRDETAVYVGRDARWVVFRAKEEKARRKR
jgi:hypothetical protein